MDEVRYCPYCMTPVKENGVCPACGLTEGSYVPAPHHLLPGTVLQDRYLIGRVLGEGGFGITYVGRDTRLGLKIAVKEYYPVGNAARNNQESITVTSSSRTTGTYEKGKSKFLQEAMTMGKLEKEPQIVGVKDFFQENNTAYIVMEYIEGTTLKELTAQRGGRIPADELFEMIKPMFGAIQHMHDLGLIHRDISPDNLMLENGDIKLLDFGCAKDVTDSSQVNQQTQTLILKHGYSPFEQYQMSSNQGPWTDVYAFGASIYYCLTGNPPPRSTDRIMGDSIVPPHKLGIRITERQEDALMKALAVRPVDRFSSMEQFHGALYGNTVETVVSEKAQKKGQIRKPKQKKTAPTMGLTVREKLFDNAEEEPEEVVIEPAKDPDRIFTVEEKPLFVTDEVEVPKDKPTEQEKKSGDKKTVIIAAVAIILVIALAVTGIVWAIVGSDNSGREQADSAVAATGEWFKIEGKILGSYIEGDASYDAYTKTISFNGEDSVSSVGWQFDDPIYLESIEVVFSERDAGINIAVNYSDGTATQSGYKFSSTITLDINSSKAVSSIVLQCGTTGTAVIESVSTSEPEEIPDYIMSIDVDITVGTAGYGSKAIDSNDERWKGFVAAVETGNYVAITADSPYILLALQIPSGWTYAERVTAVRNDDGTYTISFDCSTILEAVGNVDNWSSLYIDNDMSGEEIHVTKVEVVNDAFFFPMNVEITGGEGEVWYEVYAYGDEISARLVVPSPYHQLKDISITDIDGNVLEYTVTYYSFDYYDELGDSLFCDFTFTMPVYGANILIELYDPTEELSLTAKYYEYSGYDSNLEALKVEEADFTDENLYLCIYYDNQETYSNDFVGRINVGDPDGDYAQVYIVTSHDCGYEYIPLAILKQRAEELGYDVSDGFFFWIGVQDEDIISVDLATTGKVETVLYSEENSETEAESESADKAETVLYSEENSETEAESESADKAETVLYSEENSETEAESESADKAETVLYSEENSETEAESESADKVETVLYSKKMTDSCELSFLQDYDFTDPELYLYIYCTVDEEYLGWGPCGLCTTDWAILVGAYNDPENALVSSKQTNEDGYMAVQLSYVAEVFSDAGYDVSDGVILNWWAFIGDEPYASLTKVELVRVSG